MDPKELVHAQDRQRLLIWTLSRVPEAYHQSTISVYDNTPFPKMKPMLIDALKAIEREPEMKNVAGTSSRPYMFIASWWVSI